MSISKERRAYINSLVCDNCDDWYDVYRTLIEIGLENFSEEDAARTRDQTWIMTYRWCQEIGPQDNLEDQLGARWEEKRLDFCKQSENPYELHYFADNINWDFGTDCLYEIIKNENCDYGTAKMIFWLAQPDYFQAFSNREEVPDVNKSGWDFIQYIMNACHGRKFRTTLIQYDPRSDNRRALPPGNAKWEIPYEFS